MKWSKHTHYGPFHGSEFDITYYRSGIYKLASYKWFRGGRVDPYWQAYYINPRAESWGDYLYPSEQASDMLSLSECKKLCERHAKEYTPSPRQLKVADRSWDKWTERS